MSGLAAAWQAAMRREDHAAAWEISDAVLRARDPVTRDEPGVPYHQRWVWDGRPLAGRRVLVRCYHGLGDTLQFARYLAPLSRIVAHLTLEVQPELLELFGGIEGPDQVVPFDPARPMRAACDIEIMELAHALRLAPDASPPPYLRLPEVASPDGIGICWEAGGWDASRSIPADLLAPLLRGRRVVSLQPGACPDAFATINPAGAPAAIADTAALINGLDVVISVDSMVAHLAGALNRPTLLLLKHDADWRWMQDRDDCPVYPATRLYRQAAPGDWSVPLARVGADLQARFG